MSNASCIPCLLVTIALLVLQLGVRILIAENGVSVVHVIGHCLYVGVTGMLLTLEAGG